MTAMRRSRSLRPAWPLPESGHCRRPSMKGAVAPRAFSNGQSRRLDLSAFDRCGIRSRRGCTSNRRWCRRHLFCGDRSWSVLSSSGWPTGSVWAPSQPSLHRDDGSVSFHGRPNALLWGLRRLRDRCFLNRTSRSWPLVHGDPGGPGDRPPTPLKARPRRQAASTRRRI